MAIGFATWGAAQAEASTEPWPKPLEQVRLNPHPKRMGVPSNIPVQRPYNMGVPKILQNIAIDDFVPGIRCSPQYDLRPHQPSAPISLP